MVKALIDLLFISQKRKDLLLLLKNGEKTIEEIIDALKVNPTGMLPQIKKLKDEHLVLQEERKYRLTPLAEILVEKMEPLINTLQVIEENADYLKERHLTPCPGHSWKDLMNYSPASLLNQIRTIFLSLRPCF